MTATLPPPAPTIGVQVVPPTPTPIPTPGPGQPPQLRPPLPTTEVLTGTLGLAIGPAEPPSSAPEAAERTLDKALFIDNFVIALGYLWICCGILVLIAAAIGGVLYVRRSPRGRVAPAGPPGQPEPQPSGRPPASNPPAEPASWAAPATLSPPQATNVQPAAPQSSQQKVAARHNPAPPDPLDRPPSS